MMIYNIITAICFALLTLSVLYVFFSFVFKNRTDKISFIRGFKKGKCIAVFLIAIPLLCIGYVYGGMSVMDSILNAVSHVVDLVVLKFSVVKVSALIDDNIFYHITVYYCCVLVILNAALFALSFVGQYLWQLWNKVVRFCTRREKLVIFGNNENSISIYRSSKKYCSCIVDKISSNDEVELYSKKISYLSYDTYDDGNAPKQNKNKKRFFRKSEDALIKRILRTALKRKYIVVINYEDDEKNLRLCIRRFTGK